MRPFQNCRKYAISKLIFANFSGGIAPDPLMSPDPIHSALRRFAPDPASRSGHSVLPSALPGNKADLWMHCPILWSGAATGNVHLKCTPCAPSFQILKHWFHGPTHFLPLWAAYVSRAHFLALQVHLRAAFRCPKICPIFKPVDLSDLASPTFQTLPLIVRFDFWMNALSWYCTTGHAYRDGRWGLASSCSCMDTAV